MNRKILMLNVALVALLVWLGVRLRDGWRESQNQEEKTLASSPQPVPVAPPPPLPAVAHAPAADYLNVALQTLFAADRDPTEIIPAPPPEPEPPPPPPDPPPPPLPFYHGQMSLVAPVIVLSTAGAEQKSYKVDDKVGEFRIAAFDRETVTLEWNGKTLNPKLLDMVPKGAAVAVQAPTAPTPVRPVKSKGDQAAMGEERGAYRSCLPTDPSPNGTVKDGYRKAIVNTLMGSSCHWEPIN